MHLREKKQIICAKSASGLEIDHSYDVVPKWARPVRNFGFYSCTDLYSHSSAMSSAMDRALALKANLEEGKPSFIERMLKSHVSGGYWLASLYLFLDGDVLIFHLAQPYIFNVYTVRANEVAEVNGVTELSNPNPNPNTADSAQTEDQTQENTPAAEQPRKKRDHAKISAHTSRPKKEHATERFCFEDVKSFESFKILVDGLLLDREMPRHIIEKYYKLCCSQNAFLHSHLIEHLHVKLDVMQ